jgi:hypothetical protein
MFSFSGAVRQFSIFEKVASEAAPEIVCSARFLIFYNPSSFSLKVY